MTVRSFNLVVPLASQPTANATAMRITDTAGQLELQFAPPGQVDAVRSGAVSPLIGASLHACEDLRRGDVDSTNGRRIAPTATTLGCRTSATATRTTTTRTMSLPSESSADEIAARHADFSLAELVQAYLDCRRAKRTTPNARGFEIDQETQLCALYAALRNGNYQPGRSTCFVITRPKAREVWAAPFVDRVVHHLLYNRVAARFHRSFIADSCACIPGRGTLYAAERLEAKVRSITRNWSRPGFYLKLDIANFFVSIHKPTLRERLAARIHEAWWRALAELILFHDPRPDVDLRTPPRLLACVPPHKSLFNQPADRGLPIGNLSSQFFANIYLDALDQFVKHRLRAKHYIRYVDDMVLLHESPQWLNAAHASIAAFLQRELKVQLNPTKTILQPIERGIDFVGQVIRPWHRTIRRRTVAAALERVAHLPAADLHVTANSYFGLLRQASHSHGDRARLANVVRERGMAVDIRLTKSYRRSA